MPTSQAEREPVKYEKVHFTTSGKGQSKKRKKFANLLCNSLTHQWSLSGCSTAWMSANIMPLVLNLRFQISWGKVPRLPIDVKKKKNSLDDQAGHSPYVTPLLVFQSSLPSLELYPVEATMFHSSQYIPCPANPAQPSGPPALASEASPSYILLKQMLCSLPINI